MKNQQKFAQNRISYIVYSNPDGVRELLRQYGLEAPTDVHELARAAKKLVKQKGIQFITELIEQHPERELILGLKEKEEPQEHSDFCGACGTSNFDGSSPPFPLHDMTTHQLEVYYNELKVEAKEFSNDASLSKQIELVWSILSQRKNPEEFHFEPEEEIEYTPTVVERFQAMPMPQTYWVGLSLAFFAGLMITHGAIMLKSKLAG